MKVTVPVELFMKIWRLVGMAEAVMMIENTGKAEPVIMDLAGQLESLWKQAVAQAGEVDFYKMATHGVTQEVLDEYADAVAPMCEPPPVPSPDSDTGVRLDTGEK